MIVADTSALIAILLQESAGEECLRILTTADVAISAASLVETGIVIEARRGLQAGRELDRLLQALDATVIDVDEAQAAVARHAYRTYGKGRHPAGLNFGDCFSYALAMTHAAPLLFVGDDFSQTDVEPVTGTR